jgi:hypothetical protein
MGLMACLIKLLMLFCFVLFGKLERRWQQNSRKVLFIYFFGLLVADDLHYGGRTSLPLRRSIEMHYLISNKKILCSRLFKLYSIYILL